VFTKKCCGCTVHRNHIERVRNPQCHGPLEWIVCAWIVAHLVCVRAAERGKARIEAGLRATN
jgi:hypothetical protein